jgi:hypothetical protein
MKRYFFISIACLFSISILQAVIKVGDLDLNLEHFKLVFVFLSYIVLIISIFKFDTIHTATFSKFDIWLIGVLMVWSVISILRSADIPMSNLSALPRFLGGALYGPSLLVPLFVFLGGHLIIQHEVFRLSKLTIGYFALLSPLFFIYDAAILLAFIGFMPMLILNNEKLTTRQRVYVVIALVARMTYCILSGERLEFVRLAYFVVISLMLINSNMFKGTFDLRITGFIIIFLFIAAFGYVYTGHLSPHFSDPEIVSDIKSFERNEFNSDSHAMVIEDFFNDFDSWPEYLFGRGALGATYSPQFVILQEITNTKNNVFGFPPGFRLEIESGYLQTILKTGVLGLLLMIIIALRAIFLGVFRSKNTFTIICALIVLERYFAMNSGALAEYSMNYILYWICVGGCLSERIRNTSNIEIYFLLRGGKYYNPKFIKRASISEIGVKEAS